jgi:hypothetical protein
LLLGKTLAVGKQNLLLEKKHLLLGSEGFADEKK